MWVVVFFGGSEWGGGEEALWAGKCFWILLLSELFCALCRFFFFYHCLKKKKNGIANFVRIVVVSNWALTPYQSHRVILEQILF